MTHQKRVVLCGVCYSPNLGDGVIADCFAGMLKRVSPQLKVDHLDLAGRDGFAPASGTLRRAGELLAHAPQYLRATAETVGLEAFRRLRGLDGRWRRLLTGADAVIIGGGQLLSNATMNFPRKLVWLRDARSQGQPLAVYACGAKVSPGPGKRDLQSVLSDPNMQHIAVRDELSRAALEKLLGSPVHLAIDPAIHVSEIYRDSLDGVERGSDGVGLGLSDPHMLGYAAGATLSPEKIEEFFVDIAKQLLERGQRVTLFTNGAWEDQEYVRAFTGRHPSLAARPGFNVAPPPKRPYELVRQIHKFESVISHRLHANIVAYGLKVPSVALPWDKKLQGFFNAVERSECVLDDVSARRCLTLLDSARPISDDEINARCATSVRALNHLCRDLAIASNA